MGAIFDRWFRKLEESQIRRQTGQSESPWEELQVLDAEIETLALDGIDFVHAARQLCKLERAALFFEERRFDEARSELTVIDLGAAIPQSIRQLLNASIPLIRGNILLVRDNNPAAASTYYREVFDSGSDFVPLMRGNAAFMLGVCHDLLTIHDDSLRWFEIASQLYLSAERHHKQAEVQHAIGNAYKSAGDLNAAFRHMRNAMDAFIAQENHMGMWRTADDLTRVYLMKSSQDAQNAEKWIRQARMIASIADHAVNEVWSRSRSETGRLADLADQLLNHVVTLVDLSLVEGDDANGLAALAAYKGRVRTAQLAIDSSTTNDLPNEIAEGLALSVPMAQFEAVVQLIPEIVGGELPIALIDQFAIENGNLVSFSCVFTSEARLLGTEVSPPFEASPDGHIPDLRGRNRAGAIPGAVKRVLQEVRRDSGRCQYLVGSDPTSATDEVRQQLREWTDELAPALRQLGDWFFPESLLDFFRSENVKHVVLVIDPAFADVPYLALQTKFGEVIDEPWSLSLLTASTEVLRLTARMRSRENARSAIHVFTPDQDVNQNRGGNDEVHNMQSVAQLTRYDESMATLPAIQNCLQSGAWVHFRGHGRWTGDVTTSGPVMCNDEVLSTSNYPGATSHAGVLFTAACSTGFGEAVGSELFGSLVDYDRAGLLAAVLTLWPIDGAAATMWTNEFYQKLRETGDAAAALKFAAQSVREKLPHPFYWAPFSLIGAWRIGHLISWRQD